MANIKDVARAAGLSPAAVSLVFNDKSKGQISRENREKILKVVRELGYRPSEIARSLIRRKSNILELIIPNISSIFSTFFFTQVVSGIWSVARQKGYRILLQVNESSYVMKEDAGCFSEGSYSDGSLVLMDKMDYRLIFRLKERGLPFVLINKSNSSASCVTADYMEGAKAATQHLIELGHKKICCLRGDLLIDSDRYRLAGYKAALESHNLEIDENLVINGSFLEEKSFKQVGQLLKKGLKFSALFAISDVMAIGAMRAIKAAGLRIPEDVAVVGFDDIVLAPYLQPSLTTVRLPMLDMGKKAVEILIKKMSKKPDFEVAPERVVVKTGLIIRESCGYH